MKYKDLRKSHIIFIRDDKQLKNIDFEQFIKTTKTKKETWFFRGCKHITEKHYTEALKNLQLSDTKDALLLSTLVSFKLADRYLLENYLEELRNNTQETHILNRYELKIAFTYKNTKVFVTQDNIYRLVSSIFNR
ncbi:MAG: hypothetical protein GXO22_07690 [Aquificae bacterium]|nr:hypothetical protein [Aquificota bacterium]